MHWDRYFRRAERIEDALTRIRLKLLPPVSLADRVERETGVDDLRLFPIVGLDLCFPVASLLSRNRLEDAAQLVSDRCWVASTPLYG